MRKLTDLRKSLAVILPRPVIDLREGEILEPDFAHELGPEVEHVDHRQHDQRGGEQTLESGPDYWDVQSGRDEVEERC